MKLIAHRGASLERPENSIESLTYGAELGADLVECDVNRLADGTYIMYHDNNLKRLTGFDLPVTEISFPEFSELQKSCGHPVVTFSNLLDTYKCSTPILLHIKMEYPEEDFLEIIRKTKVPFVFGVITKEAAELLSRYFPPLRILAFIPNKSDAEAFYRSGCGIIRLWEHWLGDITPAMIKEKCPGAKVWIMSRDANKSMNGSEDSLDKCLSFGADGVLLNDIALGLRWRTRINHHL